MCCLPVGLNLIFLLAVIMQLGNLSTAYFTITIGLHTFNSLVLRKRHSAVVYGIVIAFGWIMSASIGLLSLYLDKFNAEKGYQRFSRYSYPNPLVRFMVHLDCLVGSEWSIQKSNFYFIFCQCVFIHI